MSVRGLDGTGWTTDVRSVRYGLRRYTEESLGFADIEDSGTIRPRPIGLASIFLTVLARRLANNVLRRVTTQNTVRKEKDRTPDI